MAITTTDAELLDNTDAALARPLPASIHDARADLQVLERELLAIPESALGREWALIGGGDEEVRYAFYRVLELFERAEIDAVRALATRDRLDGGLAAALIAPADAAR